KLQENVSDLRADVTGLQKDVSVLRTDVTGLQKNVADLRLHLENVTDRNIQLLAESHAFYVDRYSKVQEVSDKQYVYYIKVNYLAEDVDILKREMKLLKSRIAMP
ncbi:MAG: hypothetical protein Q4C91_23580, partial [Eubacteriales bacterium]|nr:hypothetical protein [Eubacteriales bacterium]